MVVLSRELIITSLRGFLESQGIRFGADMLGKIKMWLQCAALVAVFVTLQDYTAGDWRTIKQTTIMRPMSVTSPTLV